MPLLLRCAMLVLALAAPPQGAAAQSRIDVDVQLVLAVDSSGSVSFREFELQTVGIAGALRDPEVIEAVEHWAPHGVALSLMLWSGRLQQSVAVDWTRVEDRASLEELAAQIERAGRSLLGETAIGEALRFAAEHLERGPFRGARRIVDVSGDGVTNAGAPPGPIRDLAAAAGITINGLAILNDDLSVDRYYADQVIGGPDAFVLTARDYDDFARAMRLKLLQEIRGTPLG
ncbi:MAG TPA: DUF1194 domain-containing protein [Geminicoccaceae bacterium]|nr:DUF1194 domain-containing protein [Geminicoccaceae bacterium]